MILAGLSPAVSMRASRILGQILQGARSGIAILDNLEILFSMDLKLDPLRLLQGLSRSRTIVAAWPGFFDGDTLRYGEPSHPEYRRETKPDVIIVTCGSSDQPVESQSVLRETQA